MYSTMLPAAIRAAFHMAGVVPLVLHGLNRPVWLSSSVRVDGRPLLILDWEVGDDRLAVIADRLLTRAADHLQPEDL